MKKIFIILIFLLLIGLTDAADRQGTIIVDIKGANESFQKPFPGEFPGEFTMPTLKIGGDVAIKLLSLVIISPSSIEEESELPIKIRYRSEIDKNVLFRIASSGFNFTDYLIPTIENGTAEFEMVGKPKKETISKSYNLTLDVLANNKQYFSETFIVIVKSPLRIKILRNLEKNKFPLSLILLIICVLIYYYTKKRNKSKKI
ncbi:MAG: hypothetical protein AABW90_01340 [Nanoarchaeota archaeon]